MKNSCGVIYRNYFYVIFLYLNKKYWLENCQDERINIPGTVTKFNWTYRMPVSIETLSEDEATIEKIREICNRE